MKVMLDAATTPFGIISPLPDSGLSMKAHRKRTGAPCKANWLSTSPSNHPLRSPTLRYGLVRCPALFEPRYADPLTVTFLLCALTHLLHCLFIQFEFGTEVFAGHVPVQSFRLYPHGIIHRGAPQRKTGDHVCKRAGNRPSIPPPRPAPRRRRDCSSSSSRLGSA